MNGWMRGGVVAALAATLIGLGGARPGGLHVEENPENVAASRMEGEWVTDAALTARLKGKAVEDVREQRLVFRSDASVAGRVEGEILEFLADKPVYMAGTMTTKGVDYPFLLIELFGNPHVLFFRERDGDPMGDTESFILMFAKARDPASDLLFTGGDFNNEPHQAFRRVSADEAAGGDGR